MENDLSDNQRRMICRMAFMLFCALPTMFVTYFATHQRSADDWAKLIQAELGVETRIGAVETPRPGELILKDLKFFNNEREPIFETLQAKVTIGKSRNVAEINNPISVTRDGISFFASEVASRLIKPSSKQTLISNMKSWDVYVDNAEVVDGSLSNDRRFGFGELMISINDPLAGRELRIVGPGIGELSLVRNSGESHFGQYEIKLETDKSFPCWLAKHWFPSLESYLGTGSHFHGIASINSHYDSVCCNISGDFVGLEFPQIPKLNHIHTDGMELDLKENRWEGGAAFIVDKVFGKKPISNPGLLWASGSKPRDPFIEILRTANQNFPATNKQRVQR